MIFSDPIKTLSRLFPRRVAIFLPDRCITYYELHQYIEALRPSVLTVSSWAIASTVDNQFEAILFFLACIREKRVFFPLNSKIPQSVLADMCLETNAILIPTNVATQVVDTRMDFRLHENDSVVSLDQPVTIVATSGSTGKSKYVVHSLGNYAASAKASLSIIPFSYPDVWLLTVPLFHVSGLSILFRAFFSGAALAIPDSNQSIQDALIFFKPTHISLVPTQLLRIDKASDLSFLKHVLIGGADLPSAVYSEFSNILPLHVTYGLTEMASQVVTDHVVLSHSQLSLDSKTGEILVKGDSLCLGYYERGFIRLCLDSDGWFHTRDVGCWENDRFMVLGRLDRQFISGGENVFPEEIERAALLFEGILFATVISVSSDIYGDRPVLFFYSETVIDTGSVMNHLETYLPRFKCPDRILRLSDTFLLSPKPQFESLKKLI